MNLRYLKLLLIASALALILQGCFPPPPPHPYRHHHYRHWHGFSLQQSHAAVQLANQGGGDFNYRGEVVKWNHIQRFFDCIGPSPTQRNDTIWKRRIYLRDSPDPARKEQMNRPSEPNKVTPQTQGRQSIVPKREQMGSPPVQRGQRGGPPVQREMWVASPFKGEHGNPPPKRSAPQRQLGPPSQPHDGTPDAQHGQKEEK